MVYSTRVRTAVCKAAMQVAFNLFYVLLYCTVLYTSCTYVAEYKNTQKRAPTVPVLYCTTS